MGECNPADGEDYELTPLFISGTPKAFGRSYRSNVPKLTHDVSLLCLRRMLTSKFARFSPGLGV